MTASRAGATHRAVRTGRWRRRVAVAATLALLTAACSADDDDVDAAAPGGTVVDEGDAGGGAAEGGEVSLDEEVEITEEGGVNRVNLMRAMWNADFDVPFALEGSTQQTSGETDAFLLEAVQLSAYRAPTGGAASAATSRSET